MAPYLPPKISRKLREEIENVIFIVDWIRIEDLQVRLILGWRSHLRSNDCDE